MSKRGSYSVRISGLGDGDHDFSFKLDQEFFASFEHPEIEKGELQAQVILERKPGVLTLHFSITGEVEVVCDRCLDPFMTRVETSRQIFVKMGDTPGEIEDDVIMIGKDDHEIEVGQFMYEFILLALPIKRIHPDNRKGGSACNTEMLKKLDAHRTKDPDQAKGTDPRWDALKGIIEKNN